MEKIGNERFTLFLETVFKKNIKDITEEDCRKLKTIPVEETNLHGEREEVDLKEILPFFPNLETIHFERSIITQEDIELLSNLKEISFSKCDTSGVEDYSSLNKLEKVEWVQCYYQNHDWLNTLNRNIQSLSIRYPYVPLELDIHSISDINLKELLIEGYSLKNEEELDNYQNCEFLSLYQTKVTEKAIRAIEEMPALKEVIIEEKLDPQRMQNKDVEIKEDYRDYLFEDVSIKLK